MKLSQHLASPSVASLSHSNELDGLRLSPHFTLGEMTKTSHKTADGNIPSHVAIENLKRLCGWLEMLREEWNKRYGEGNDPIIITYICESNDYSFNYQSLTDKQNFNR